jgi:heme oxygenase
MTLTERLKQTIAADHARIEALPLTAAMLAGRLPRAAYLALLAELEAVHDPLEAELQRHAADVPAYRPAMARTELLRRDRVSLGGAATLPGALPETRALVARVREWAETAPWALLGVLYVFEGSRMGSLVLAKRIAAALAVPAEPGRGLDYHLDGAADRPRAWVRFKAELDALPVTPAQADAIERAAAETMERLCAVYAAVPAAEPSAAA